MKADIRKTAVIVEETRKDIGKAVNPPTRKAAAIAVIVNPFAGRYVEDLSDLMEIGASTLRSMTSQPKTSGPLWPSRHIDQTNRLFSPGSV